MPDPSLRVLVADSSVLIALDLERILVESCGCEVTIITLAALGNELQRGSYDVVMIDAAMSERVNMENAGAVLDSGAELVFLSSFDDFRQAFPGLADCHLLTRPYDPALAAELLDKVTPRNKD